MSFLSNFETGTTPRSLDRWSYSRNPFPSGPQVVPEVFVDRPELAALKRDLGLFLRDPAEAGGFWALQGGRGLGKTNFLRHVELEVQRLEDEAQVSGVTVRYLTAQAAHPRRVVGELIAALGEPRLTALLKDWSSAAPTLPEPVRSTDFERFVNAVVKRGARPVAVQQAHAFLVRWLGGQQTVKEERETFGVLIRDRLPPAVSLPFLSVIIDMLVERGVLRGVVLLIDELEDFQALALPERQDYAHTLKSIVNTFNQRRLFLIAAGQVAAFNTLKVLYPSIESRWNRADLVALQNAGQAVRLARAYMEHEHRQWLAAGKGRKKVEAENLQPNRTTIEAAFARTLPNNDHRRLLTELHGEFEKMVEGE